MAHLFRSLYTIDVLLRIIGEYSDELKVLAISSLTLLVRDREIQSLFKQFNASQKLIM